MGRNQPTYRDYYLVATVSTMKSTMNIPVAEAVFNLVGPQYKFDGFVTWTLESWFREKEFLESFKILVN